MTKHTHPTRDAHPLLRLQVGLLALFGALLARLIGTGRDRDDRGDVPGWVLVTVMSAGLVMAIWKVAGPQLTDMVSSALSSVHP